MSRKPLSRFTPLAFALLSAAGLLTTAIAAQINTRQSQAASPMALEPFVTLAQAIGPVPASRREGDLAMDGAVAAAVIGAVSRQFDERRVEVKLDSVAVQPASIRDRKVSGHGRILIGDDAALGSGDRHWIPMRFSALYDTHSTSVSRPVLVLGDSGQAAKTMELDAPLVIVLGMRIDSALAREFGQQSAQMRIDRVTAAPAGPHYLRMQAFGTADFATEGTTAARVEALYDRRNGQWLHLAYELGTTSNWADEGESVIALR